MKTKILNVIGGYLVNQGAIILSIFILIVANLAFAPKVFATTLTHTTVMEYNMNAAATSQIAVAFTAAATDTPGSVVLTFTGWTANSGVVGASVSQTVNGTTCQAITGATNALATLGTPTSVPASGTITVPWTSTTLTSGQSYCFTLTYASAVTNPTAGVYQVTVAVDGTDTNTVGIDVISNDQITVSATVPQSFTMALSGNTDSLGTLSSAALSVSTSSVTATINTNALTGWFLWAEDSNTGLTSPTASHTISSLSVGSNHSMNGGTIGTEAYVIGVPSVTSGTVATAFADAGGITGGGINNSTYTQLASNTVASASDVVSIKELADISATTRAANDYADVITLVGAGSF